MRILLLNPSADNIIALELPRFIRENEGFFPPLGLMYIAAYLRSHCAHEVRILDALANKLSVSDVQDQVRQYSPDIVGITAHTHNLIDVIMAAEAVKRTDPSIHVCLGGPHVNVYPQESVRMSSVDSVVKGYGEKTFAKLVGSLESGSCPSKIPGVICKNKEVIAVEDDGNDVFDPDGLTFPDRSMVDNRLYSNVLGTGGLTTTMISGRGCPFNCSFCSTPKGPYLMRSAENVVMEMENCLSFGIKEVNFVDDTFNSDRVRVLEICRLIKRRSLNVKWSFRGRIDCIDKELLDEVVSAGCARINLGVETSSDEGLRILQKGITVSQIRRAFQLTGKAKIKTVAYFLIGCPHEKNANDILRTIDFAKELDPDYALFNILTPYPGTELYRQGIALGVLKGDAWKGFVSSPSADFRPALWTQYFTEEELRSFLGRAYKSFYLRPGFIARALTRPGNIRRLLKAGSRISGFSG